MNERLFELKKELKKRILEIIRIHFSENQQKYITKVGIEGFLYDRKYSITYKKLYRLCNNDSKIKKLLKEIKECY